LISQIAFKTYFPIFVKSLWLKCYPAFYPLLAPAKDASNV